MSDSSTPWTVAHQAPLSMGFSRQEYWGGVALPSSRGSSQPRDQIQVPQVSCHGRWVLYHCVFYVASVMSNSLQPYGLAHQAPLSMGFSKQEYWSGLPCLPPEDLPNPGIEPAPLRSSALAGIFFTASTTWEAPG